MSLAVSAAAVTLPALSIAGCSVSHENIADWIAIAPSLDEQSSTPETEPARMVDDAWSAPMVLRGSTNEESLSARGVHGYVAPIHLTLLPNKQIFVVGYARPTFESTDALAIFRYPSYAGTFDVTPAGGPIPRDVYPQPVATPYTTPYWTRTRAGYIGEGLFCSGHTLTRDGKLFFAGGTRVINPTDTAPSDLVEDHRILGLPTSMVYDPWAATMVKLPSMTGVAPDQTEALRWYPTVMRLADGRVMVANGWSRHRPLGGETRNLSFEVFDARTSRWSRVSAHPDLPEAHLPTTPEETAATLYPHVLQLPVPVDGRFDLLALGNESVPTLFTLGGMSGLAPSTTERPEWRVLPDSVRPGLKGAGGTSATAMLPLRTGLDVDYNPGAVMIVGGECTAPRVAPFENVPAEKRIDIYDPLENRWRDPKVLGVGRHHAALVTLPDGKMVVFGGQDDCVDEPPFELGRAVYVDPFDDFRIGIGISQAYDELRAPDRPEVLGYHMTALLLPDGRVLVGGGRHGSQMERVTFRYYSPWYMFRARPRIERAPEMIRHGEIFEVEASGPTVREAVLVGLGSMTHSFDANQRNVQLEVLARTSDERTQLTLRAPKDGRWAPPGHYMLFLLDENRVPSEARIVHVGGLEPVRRTVVPRRRAAQP
jgi:hypothetical protein